MSCTLIDVTRVPFQIFFMSEMAILRDSTLSRQATQPAGGTQRLNGFKHTINLT